MRWGEAMPQLYVLHALAWVVGIGTACMLVALAVAAAIDRWRVHVVPPLAAGDDGANITRAVNEYGRVRLVKGAVYRIETPIVLWRDTDGQRNHPMIDVRGAHLRGR